MSDLRIDHVIYVVEDLDAASARFREALGLGSVVGGRHVGWGTANRLVPLGHEYVELVAVADRAEAAGSDFGRVVMQTAASGGGLAGWAVATDDLQSIARRLNLEVTHGARTRPDWNHSALAAGRRRRRTGRRGLSVLHPMGRTARASSGRRRRGAPRVPAGDRVDRAHWWRTRHWRRGSAIATFPVRITEGPQSLSAVAISTTAGELVLPSRS